MPLIKQPALAMPLIILEVPLEHSAIGVLELAGTVPLILPEQARVGVLLTRKHSEPIHSIIPPVPPVDAIVEPALLTVPIFFVVMPVAAVG